MLRIALGEYPWTKGFAQELAASEIAECEFVTVSPITRAFREMCRSRSFDVCELALSTYVVARSYKLPFTAVPVFPVRAVHLPMMCARAAELSSPKDLEDKKVAVRAYTVTGGVWARAFLASEFGVNLEAITWVLGDEEHVREFHADAPRNLEYRVGEDLDSLAERGEVVCVIGSRAKASKTFVPLLSDQIENEEAWAKKLQIYPINHTVVLGDWAREQYPELSAAIYVGFCRAKAAWMATVEDGRPLTTEETELLGRRPWVGEDPLPYGVKANTPTLRAMETHLKVQRIPVPGDVPLLFDDFD